MWRKCESPFPGEMLVGVGREYKPETLSSPRNHDDQQSLKDKKNCVDFLFRRTIRVQATAAFWRDRKVGELVCFCAGLVPVA